MPTGFNLFFALRLDEGLRFNAEEDVPVDSEELDVSSAGVDGLRLLDEYTLYPLIRAFSSSSKPLTITLSTLSTL